ncbi:uncharacterized protein LOC62_05G007540 [Vanrija pseudolonga]|uniref:Uncharacterized protein n=1 Tax=Vanrija pseudolonga TaxID=143232 RepID=A0AAF0YC36_9TREE|nr:hypothetical protein LOC62_05G007540 [Vanrija pseudolonga]
MNRERRSSFSALFGIVVSSEDRNRFLVDHSTGEMDKVFGTILLPSIMKTKDDVRKCLNRYYGPDVAFYPFRILQAFVDYQVWSRKSDREIDGFTDPYSIETDLEILEREAPQFPRFGDAFSYVRQRGGIGQSRVIPMRYPPQWTLDKELRAIRPVSGAGSRLYSPTTNDSNPRRISLTMSMSDKDPGAFDVNEFGLRRPGSLDEQLLSHTDSNKFQREGAPSPPTSPRRWEVNIVDASNPTTHFPSAPASPAPSGRNLEHQHGDDWTLDLERQLSLNTAESSTYSTLDTPTTDDADLFAARISLSKSLGITRAAETPIDGSSPSVIKPKTNRAATWVGVGSSLNRYALLNRTRTEAGTSSTAANGHRFSRSLSGLIRKIPSSSKERSPQATEAELAPLSPNLSHALSLPRGGRDRHMRSSTNLDKPAPPEGAAVATKEFGL